MWLRQAVDRKPSFTSVAKLVEVLLWLGEEPEARRVAKEGAGLWGLWLHPLQRPTTYYKPELLAKPWWSAADDFRLARVSEYFASRQLVEQLRDELAAVVRRRPRGWRHQPELLQEPGTGRWKEWKVQDERGAPCRQALFPRTCDALRDLTAWVDVQWAEYSVLEPGARIRPHTGPTNDRLSAHVCVSTSPGVRIRIGGGAPAEYRNGSVLLFDDSFEHQVWHDGARDRAVLLVQFTHLGLPASSRASGSPLSARSEL